MQKKKKKMNFEKKCLQGALAPIWKQQNGLVKIQSNY